MRRSQSTISMPARRCWPNSSGRSMRRPTSGRRLRLAGGAEVCPALADLDLDNRIAADGARLALACVDFGKTVDRVGLVVDDFGATLLDSRFQRPSD